MGKNMFLAEKQLLKLLAKFYLFILFKIFNTKFLYFHFFYTWKFNIS